MTSQYDILIVGGGFAGLSLANAIHSATKGETRIVVVDGATGPPTIPRDDIRASAISAASKNFLHAIGVWHEIESYAQPVTSIEITDSRLDDVVRPTRVTFSNTIATGSAATFILQNKRLLSALATAARRASPALTLLSGTPRSLTVSNSAATLTLSDATALTAPLVIAADGRRSFVREQAGIKILQWQYAQTGIVTIVSHEQPHESRAVQHFLPSGPFAILPLIGDEAAQPRHRSCVTWSEASDEARRIMALDERAFLAEVERRFGHRLGNIALVSERASWPLDMHLAHSMATNRIALVGDAAHGVHPIAGQGLNLGIRDIAALTEVVVDAQRLGLDIGHATVLERYERWRRLDNAMSTAAFDAVNAVFSAENTILRSARGAGMGLIDQSSYLKQLLVTEAAGLTGDIPKLLRGEKL